MFEEVETSKAANNKSPAHRYRDHQDQLIRTKRILIVDDNTDLRIGLAEILVNDGFKVATAKNGLEALKYLSSHDSPDLILLDLKMPVMDGYGLMEKMREKTELKKIPVIIISGEVDEKKIRELAMDKLELLPKPLDLQNFVNVVEKATF